jgi:hypothetical protein
VEEQQQVREQENRWRQPQLQRPRQRPRAAEGGVEQKLVEKAVAEDSRPTSATDVVEGVSDMTKIPIIFPKLTNNETNFYAGKVRSAFKEWKKLTSDTYILELVSGLRLVLDNDEEEDLHKRVTRRIKFNEVEKIHVTEEIRKLEEKGVVKKVTAESGQFISNIFLRPKKDGSFRVILNLKQLNESIKKVHFKLDSLKAAIELMKKDCFFASLDIKDAYYSVALQNSCKKLFRFLLDDTLYEFQGLPQGYRDAPRLFTKLLKPVLSKLHEEGHTLLIYFDDTLIQGDSFEDCAKAVNRAATLLDKLGFTIHPKKSVFKPCKAIEFLGFILDSNSMTVRLTDAKIAKIINVCKEVRDNSEIQIQKLAELIGNLVAAVPGVEFGRVFIKRLEIFKIKSLVKAKGNYAKNCSLNETVKEDIDWWISNLPKAYYPIRDRTPTITVKTDASLKGWGGERSGNRAGGMWTEAESAEEHINILELKGALFSLKSLCKDVRNTSIKVLSDNVTAVASINKMGSTKRLLNEVARNIWLWCQERQNYVIAVHLPGKENIEADEESRADRHDIEWKLDPKLFKTIQEMLDVKDDVDLFASRVNNQLDKYVSWGADPFSWDTDAFSLNWNDFSPYCFPPFSLVPRVLQRLELTEAECTLIAPKWTTKPWYMKMMRLLIKEPIVLPRSRKVIKHPLTGESHPILKNTEMIACRLSGKASKSKEYREKLLKSSLPHGEKGQRNHIAHTSGNGAHFVIEGVKVPFTQLRN